MKKLPLALNLLALAVPGILAAQDKPVLSIPRIEGTMKADGKLDEPFWQQAAVTGMPYEIVPSTPLSPTSIMRLIAFTPPPPMPTTLMTAK